MNSKTSRYLKQKSAFWSARWGHWLLLQTYRGESTSLLQRGCLWSQGQQEVCLSCQCENDLISQDAFSFFHHWEGGGERKRMSQCSSWHVLEANFYFCLVHKRLENESANDKWQKEPSPFSAGPRLSERRANRSCAYLQVSGMLSSDFLCHRDVRLCDEKGGHLRCGTQL